LDSDEADSFDSPEAAPSNEKDPWGASPALPKADISNSNLYELHSGDDLSLDDYSDGLGSSAPKAAIGAAAVGAAAYYNSEDEEVCVPFHVGWRVPFFCANVLLFFIFKIKKMEILGFGRLQGCVFH